MGVVYRAEDTRLRRSVALKFLRPQVVTSDEDRARFVREAQAAAALDHPNICTVYEVGEADGQMYISMAFVEGHELRDEIREGPIEVFKALSIAREIATGLAAAHRKGIVHRDIKSSNVMMTDDGRVRIMDFGLAKSEGSTKVTRTGTTIGTAAYMSPEQALGQDVDQRTDIWSLGVVLYEMLTGQLPFKGDYEPAMIYSIVNETPEPLTSRCPEIPLEVERVIGKALEKDPDKRYPDAESFGRELDGLLEGLDLLPRRSRLQLRLIHSRRRIIIGVAVLAAAVILTGIVSRLAWKSGEEPVRIAVLPCAGSDSSHEDDWFEDAATSDIISYLSTIDGLAVISQRSVDKFRGSDASPAEIADELDAAMLIFPEATISGNTATVSAQMIDPETDVVIFDRPFRQDFAHVEKIWRDIAILVAETLEIELSDTERSRLTALSVVDPDAYRYFQEGRALWRLRVPGATQQCEALFEKAIEEDSLYAPSWAALAELYVTMAQPVEHWGTVPYPEIVTLCNSYLERAMGVAERAISLDPELAEGHTALGTALRWTDPEEAERQFLRAIDLKPSDVWPHYWYAGLLSWHRRHDEAIEQSRIAVSLDPLVQIVQDHLGENLAFAGRYEEAEAELEKTRLMNPKWDQTYFSLTFLYWFEGEFVKVAEAIGTALRNSRLDIDPQPMINVFLAMAGEIPAEETYPTVELLENVYGPWFSAALYVSLEDTDRAFAALHRGLSMGDPMMNRFVNRMPVFDPLRADPRFVDILRAMGFEPGGIK